MQKSSILESSLIMFGESGAGKTSILYKLMKEDINILKVSSTSAIQFQQLKGNHRQKRFSIAINDIPGQKTYRFAVPSYFRRKQIYTYVFDSEQWYNGKKQKILKEIDQWFQIARDACQYVDQQVAQNCVVVFLANKIDLINQNERQAFEEDVAYRLKEKLQLYKAKLFFTSALLGENVKVYLNYVLDEIYTRHEKKKNVKDFLPDFDMQNRESQRDSIELHSSKFKEKKNKEKTKWFSICLS